MFDDSCLTTRFPATPHDAVRPCCSNEHGDGSGVLVTNIVCKTPGRDTNGDQAVFARALKSTLTAVFGPNVRCFRDMPLDYKPDMVSCHNRVRVLCKRWFINQSLTVLLSCCVAGVQRRLLCTSAPGSGVCCAQGVLLGLTVPLFGLHSGSFSRMGARSHSDKGPTCAVGHTTILRGLWGM